MLLLFNGADDGVETGASGSRSGVTSSMSGIVLNQNALPIDPAHHAPLDVEAWLFSEFTLPRDYQRGSSVEEYRLPNLSGLQFMVNDPSVDNLNVEVCMDFYSFELGWVRLSQGTLVDTPATGDKVWLTYVFDEIADVGSSVMDTRLRVGLRGFGADVWYVQPNPLELPYHSKATDNMGFAFQPNGVDVSLNFRVLGMIADEGVDFLGNNYRSVVVENKPESLGSASTNYWMSKPNPSKFAIEALYFNLRDENGAAQVVDQILVDPVTPGVYFAIYYSDEGEPGVDDNDWDSKLWTHVPGTYQATKRESHYLPEPVTASYFKLEFSHLQARDYNAGSFENAIVYRKHPKWVLDYFIARTDAYVNSANKFVPNRVGITYDAIKLAYNYYLDDLQQAPEGGQPSVQDLAAYLTDDLSSSVDQETMAQINLALKPYQQPISDRGPSQQLLGQVIAATAREANLSFDYPTERAVTAQPWNATVSSLQREEVVFELDFPVMFYYLTCRHQYRQVSATLAGNRAYFVGVRQVSFERDRYTTATDTAIYVEPGGDLANANTNDFVRYGGSLKTQ